MSETPGFTVSKRVQESESWRLRQRLLRVGQLNQLAADREREKTVYRARRCLDEVRAAKEEIATFRAKLPAEVNARRLIPLRELSPTAQFVLVAEEVRDQLIKKRGERTAPDKDLFFGNLAQALLSARETSKGSERNALLTVLFVEELGRSRLGAGLASNATLGEMSDHVSGLLDGLKDSSLWRGSKSTEDREPDRVVLNRRMTLESVSPWMELQAVNQEMAEENLLWLASQIVSLVAVGAVTALCLTGVGEVLAAGTASLATLVDVAEIANLVFSLVEGMKNLSQFAASGETTDAFWGDHEDLHVGLSRGFAVAGVALGIRSLAGKGLRALSKAKEEATAVGRIATIKGRISVAKLGWSSFVLGQSVRERWATELVRKGRASGPFELSTEEKIKLGVTFLKLAALGEKIESFEKTYQYLGPILEAGQNALEAKSAYEMFKPALEDAK